MIPPKLLDTTEPASVELRTVKTAVPKIMQPRPLLAIALMFWCAGTGCIMVSYARASMGDMDASAQSALQPMSTSAAMNSHACCKAKHQGLNRSITSRKSFASELTQFTLPSPAQGDAMSCCPLTSGSIVVASRSQTNDNASEVAHTNSSSPKLENSNQTPVAVPLRLPNRARSYLLDCAFLI